MKQHISAMTQDTIPSDIQIVLCDEKCSRNHFTVTASLEGNKLTVEGHDFGLAPLRTWGTNEYQYWYIFDEKNTKLLMSALLENGPDPLEQMKLCFAGTSACRNLRAFCKEKSIEYHFDNLSVYSEEDNHLIDEDNASGGPTFINLRHAVDITDEYRTHHAPRSTIIGPYQGLYGRNFLIAFFKDRGITDDEIEWYARWGGLPYGEPTSRMTANAYGMQYAKERADEIIKYREATQETMWTYGGTPPWEWYYAKDFYRIYDLDRIPDSIPVYNIYECVYQGKTYYYGVGKEETPITEDMRKNGKWYGYTWAD